MQKTNLGISPHLPVDCDLLYTLLELDQYADQVALRNFIVCLISKLQ